MQTPLQTLDHLNEAQRQAVTLEAEHALILAGAGSGKTRVLTTRIAWLLQTAQCSPCGILAVTFTNKAAREILTRLACMLQLNPRGMWVGTFHGLCNRLLRAHYREAGLPQTFQILDAADQLSAIKRLLKTLNVDDETHPPKELQHFINAQKEAGIRAQAVEAWDSFTRRRAEIYLEYERQCEREGVADFAELLLRSYELLTRNEPLRAHYQNRFRYILVDEFQDTNQLQYRWLCLLAKDGQPDGARLFCVGDDDQSIYRFRGADVGNMREFERKFAVKHLIRLEQNYRSGGTILEAANAIITHNTQRLGKNLWTDQGPGEPIRVFEGYNDQEEARWIVEEIQSLLREGTAPDQIALLYRANALSRGLEQQLFTSGVAYRVYGGLRFFERQEIKHALAYLRLLANPDDDTAFLRIVNFPTRGIGARALENLQDAARTFNTPLYATVPHVAGKAGSALGQFVRMIETLRQATRHLPLPEIIEHVIEHTGLRTYYKTEKEGQDRLENLDELISAATQFASDPPPTDEGSAGDMLSQFLAHASLEAGDHQAGANEAAVQMMSVHAAKGLEFDIVFLCGLEEGLFPHENSLAEQDGLEEERRLMYVAVTRARKRLYLCCTQSRMLHGQIRYNLRSRFLEEIPEPLLKWLTPRPTHPAYSDFSSTSAPRVYPKSPATAHPKPAPSADLDGFYIGQNVRHPRFGEGVITGAESSGKNARLEINFGKEGTKWLVLGLAKLEKL